MESFTLTCTTCKSRLKVRDTGVVGQIMACPKCGGMVLIKPPEPGEAPSYVRSNETGETKPDLSNPLLNPARQLPPLDTSAPLKADAFDDVDVLLGDVPARTMVPSPTVRPGAHGHGPGHPAPIPLPPPKGATPATTQSFIRPADQNKSPDSQAATQSQNEIPSAQPAAQNAGQQGVKAQPVAKSAAPAASSKQPEPQRAAAAVVAAQIPQPTNSAAVAPNSAAPPQPVMSGSPWQYWAMVSASGLLGVLLAVGVVAITISWFSTGSKPLPTPLAQNPNPQIPVVPETLPPTPDKQSTPVDPMARLPMDPGAPTEPVVPPPMTEAPSPMPVQPMPALPMPMPTPATPERDPLGLTDPPPAKPGLTADDPFGKFGEILNGGPTDPAPPPKANPAAIPPVIPPPEEEANPSPTAAKIPKPQTRHIDVAARLAEPLPAIDIQNSPLIDFLQVMQDMSTVPITLRPDGLAMVRFTPYNAETPVAWKGSATTVHDAIQGALQPLGLEAKVEADQLIVDVASPQLITMKVAVKDLTGSDERKATELAALLMSSVAPDSWSDEDGQPSLSATKDELTVRQTRPVLADCLLFVEKLRVARGLPPQTKFDSKLFALTTRHERAAAVLATPLMLNYSIPTSLSRVLDRLGKEAKVRILLDWQSLAAAGWNPDAEVTLSVEKQPLSSALNDLTQRMDLTWRVVDAKTIQILSPLTQADRTELEFYSVADLAADPAAGAALVAKVRNTLGGQAFRDAGGRGEIRFDATGKCLIANLSQPQQQQVATLLKTLRGVAPVSK